MLEKAVGNFEISLTGDEVVIHIKTWYHLQSWLDECCRWACKKKMKWESSKCTFICSSNGEVNNERLALLIAGGVIKKVKSPVCLWMNISSRGLLGDLN